MTTHVDKDMDSLKKDLGKFRDDISTVLSDVGHFSQEKVHLTKEKLGTMMKDFENIASNKISGTTVLVQETSKKAVNASRQAVKQKPLVSVAASFFAGLAAAMFLRRHHEQH